MEPWLIILLIVGALLALVIILWLCWAAFIGAAFLFVFAGEQGFIGLAAYIACWVLFFPVMLVICILIGIFLLLANRGE